MEFSRVDSVERAKLTLQRVKGMLRQMTPDLSSEVKEWKSDIATAFLSLVLGPVKSAQEMAFQDPISEYSIDLSVSSRVLPRQFQGKVPEIDEETRDARSCHEKRIEEGQIKCYKINKEKDLIQFESRSVIRGTLPSLTWSRREAVPCSQQLANFSFPDHKKNMVTPGACKGFRTTQCAYPNCKNKEGTKNDATHLQLCQVHMSHCT